ncbi:probable G-protein coupled receptor 139 [Narcine bancroftii]|uniref:probable G-protein coupled receptor 139 n=1 Tax=Narcine bancroftii TaxID=1343680 RepID=UPI0038316F75
MAQEHGHETYVDLTAIINMQLKDVQFRVNDKILLCVNLIAICILCRGKCGLSKCVSRYLVGMAAADLMAVVIGVILDQVNNIYSYARSLMLTPVCATIVVLRHTAMDCSVWFTVAFTFDRCITICTRTLRERLCTKRIATVVMVIVVIGSCVRCAPFYFAIDPLVIIDNVPWRCITTHEYVTSSFWKTFQLFHVIITPVLPIGFIVLFNALTVSFIVAANNARRALRKKSENQNDPEVENRIKSMILLFSVSANFILLWIPIVVYYMNWQFPNYFYTDRYLNTPSFILQQFGYMLQFLCTCSNTCIYAFSVKRFREELKNGFKYLFTFNGQLSS